MIAGNASLPHWLSIQPVLATAWHSESLAEQCSVVVLHQVIGGGHLSKLHPRIITGKLIAIPVPYPWKDPRSLSASIDPLDSLSHPEEWQMNCGKGGLRLSEGACKVICWKKYMAPDQHSIVTTQTFAEPIALFFHRAWL